MVVAPDGGVGMVGAGRPHGMDAHWSHASMYLWLRAFSGLLFCSVFIIALLQPRAASGAPRSWPSTIPRQANWLVGSSPSPPAPRRKVSRLRFQPPPRGGGAARELEHRQASMRPYSSHIFCSLCACAPMHPCVCRTTIPTIRSRLVKRRVSTRIFEGSY
jgi:hypothetical protein